jgi:RND superfamily putative drug exporter
MSSKQSSSEHTKPPFVPRTIHRLAVPIILAWLAIVFLVSTAVPSLEQVSTARSVSLSPKDAPSVQAMERMGQKFKESDSDSFAMIVLESQQKLGDDAHRYYNSLIRQLKEDTTHVQHVQDFWGIHSLRPLRRALMANAYTFKSTSPVTKARPWDRSPATARAALDRFSAAG